MSRFMYKMVATFADKKPETSYYATLDETLHASEKAKQNGATNVEVTPK